MLCLEGMTEGHGAVYFILTSRVLGSSVEGFLEAAVLDR